MARRNIANFKSTVDILFPDNTGKQITPDRVRSILYDAADSFLFSFNRKRIDVTGATITLNWENMTDTFMVCANAEDVGDLVEITTNKTIVFANSTNAIKGDWLVFVGAGLEVTLQWPSNVFFPSYLDGWTFSSKQLVLRGGNHKVHFDTDGGGSFLNTLTSYQ